MAAVKTIAIIGATGNMGAAIARTLSNSPYRLLLMARQQNRLFHLLAGLKAKSKTEIDGVACEKDACWEADIIILAVPYAAQIEVAEKIRAVATQKVVISLSNPLNETNDRLRTAAGYSAAEELQNALPHSKVVKAFNTVFASDLMNAPATEKPIKTFLAGDDAEALQTVSQLAVAMGLQPVITGKLTAAAKLEEMMLPLIELKMEEHYNFISGWNIHPHAPVNFKSACK